MDELKKYLQQHQPEMDLDEPGPLVWEKIIEPKNGKRPAVIKMMLRFSAAAVIAIGLFFGVKIFTKEKRSTGNPDVAVKQLPAKIDTPKNITVVPNADTTPVPVQNIAAATKEKKQDERYALMNSFKENYAELVNYQLKNIRSTPVYAENADYFNDFKTRLQQMDADEKNIRVNIRKYGMGNALLEQLINVYQQKLDVLKSLQQEINKMNTRVHENFPADSLNKFYLNI